MSPRASSSHGRVSALAVSLALAICACAGPPQHAAEARDSVRSFHESWPVNRWGGPGSGVAPYALPAETARELGALSAQVLAWSSVLDREREEWHAAWLVSTTTGGEGARQQWLLAHLVQRPERDAPELAPTSTGTPLRTYDHPPTPDEAYAFVADSGWLDDMFVGADMSADVAEPIGHLARVHWFELFRELPGALHFGELADHHARLVAGEAAREPSGEGVTEIGFERHNGFGRSARYTARFTPDGVVQFVGRRYGWKGRATGDLAPGAFESLAARLLDAGFTDFEPTYEMPHTHFPSFYLLIVRDGERFVVKQNAAPGPPGLDDLVEMLDGAVDAALLGDGTLEPWSR